MQQIALADGYRVDAGFGSLIEASVSISGRSGPRPRRLVIGDNVFIGAGTRIVADDVEIGDYTTIHQSCLIAGDKPFKMGHCCWVGENTILNCTGGLYIGNAVGIGAYSQLWTHIRFGDMLQGCVWNDTREMVVEDDVWFVGHCIVSPIRAASRSMALAGSVITEGMASNRVYAGVPARDITDKVGPQFRDTSLEAKLELMSERLKTFAAKFDVDVKETFRVVGDWAAVGSRELAKYTVFNVATREYTKRRSGVEIAFMRFLLPDVKFFPGGPELESANYNTAEV